MDDDHKTEHLIAEVERRRGARCGLCGAPACGHAVLFGFLLGHKDEARCVPCLARSLARDAEALRREARSAVRARDCFRAAWARATADEPACPEGVEGEARPAAGARADEASAAASARWDAGDLACGDLALQLRLRLSALGPGAVMHLTARDPGAREDVPSWCRVTGHRLVRAAHPDYWIETPSPHPLED